MQWTNPHVRWYIDVKNEKTGEVETWMLQGSGPGAYKANGISATGVFPIGKTYTAHDRARRVTGPTAATS